MRVQRHALLVLPALLSVLVAAIPSPTTYFQQPLTAPAVQQQPPPRWRTLSDRLIGSLWKTDDHKLKRPRLQDERNPPPHTIARYGGDIVLRFNVSTSDEVKSLAEAADVLLLDVWEFSQDWVDIRLAKDIVPSLLGLLPPSLQQSHKPLLRERDLAQAVQDTYQSHDSDSDFFFNDYQPLHVIEPWMRFLASFFSTHVRLINIGLSYEGRDILGLRVGVHPRNNEDPEPPRRKTVVVTGGLHAREWISTSTVNYIALSLITGYGKTGSITRLLEEFDFVFVPTLNPDGYEYTWKTDRLWRKNRQQTSVRFCQGIDLDKGFGFEWDGVTTAGNPCSESFAGQSPFQATESKRLADWARNETDHNNVTFVGFLDLHSYSQQILYPYSYSCQDTPPGQENLEELATGLEKAIRLSSGYSYEVMAACEGNVAVSLKDGKRTLLPRIEEQGGSALDWFYHELHVQYAYQIKLRDRGTYGFLLPKYNIVPTGKEILNAVLYLGDFLMEQYVVDKNGQVEFARPELDIESTEEGGVSQALGTESIIVPGDDLDTDCVVVDDLVEEDAQWELRRRRRR